MAVLKLSPSPTDPVLAMQKYTSGSGAHPTLGAFAEQRFLWRAADATPVGFSTASLHVCVRVE